MGPSDQILLRGMPTPQDAFVFRSVIFHADSEADDNRMKLSMGFGHRKQNVFRMRTQRAIAEQKGFLYQTILSGCGTSWMLTISRRQFPTSKSQPLKTVCTSQPPSHDAIWEYSRNIIDRNKTDLSWFPQINRIPFADFFIFCDIPCVSQNIMSKE